MPVLEHSEIDELIGGYATHEVLPPGELPVPIPEGRGDLDYENQTRLKITHDNGLLVNAEERFWGNPHYPQGEEDTGIAYDEHDFERVVTKEQPAKYFYPEAALVLATNRPRQTEEELEIARETNQMVEVVNLLDLSSDGQGLFVAHVAGALEEVVDLSLRDPDNIKAVAIIHHSPTDGTIPYPRSAWDLHATVGAARRNRLREEAPETPQLTVERFLLNHNELINLKKKMTEGLKDQGFGTDQVRVTIRDPKPTGIGVHLLNLNRDNLTSREGIEHARDVFVAVSTAYGQTHPQIIEGLPPSFDFNGTTIYRSDTPAHRQILHPYKNHFVYALTPMPIGTNVGGGEASRFKPNRSIVHRATDADMEAVHLFNKRIKGRIQTSTGNWRQAA